MKFAKAKMYIPDDPFPTWNDLYEAGKRRASASASAYVKVAGSDIRAGDFIQYEVTEDGEEIIGTWNVEVVSQDGQLGYIDRWGKNFLSGDARFVSSRYFTVRTPRPHPPSNEFGPVHP